MDNVAEAGISDHACSRALVLKNGVRCNGRTMKNKDQLSRHQPVSFADFSDSGHNAV